jgi:hypothetical protein
LSPHTKDSLGKSVGKNSVNKKTLEESFFAFNNMDFRNHNRHMEDSLGTAGNMGDMEDNMGMDLVLPVRFPLIPLLILLIIHPQTEHQRKRIVDLDEGFCFCIRTLDLPPFCLAYYFHMQTNTNRSGQATNLSQKDLVQ